MSKKPTPEERFWAKVDKTSDPNGCWIFTGATDRVGGYFGLNGKNILAHRYSWILKYGEIPKNKVIAHSCLNNSCVNPNHLYLLDITKVQSYKKMSAKNRFWTKVNRTNNTNDCWEWLTGKSKDGYGRFWFKGKNIRAHRYSWLIHFGSPPNNESVLHNCDNPICVNPNHLFVGTHDDNMKDKTKKGRQTKGDIHYARTNPEKLARGKKHGTYTHPEKIVRGDQHFLRKHPEKIPLGEEVHNSKLTKEQVLEIRKRYIYKIITANYLAKEYGVDESTIFAIIKRKNWKHI